MKLSIMPAKDINGAISYLKIAVQEVLKSLKTVSDRNPLK